MQSKFITVGGIRLAYLEKNPKGGKIIFFVHGNSSSSSIWQAQFASERFSGYRLIAFDLPAHGQSGTAPLYSLPDLGRVMAAAVRQMAGVGEYVICGVSLGVNIMAEMLHYQLAPTGLIIIGSCAFGGSFTMEIVFKPGADLRPSMEDNVSEEELKQYWTNAGICYHDEKGEKYQSFKSDYFNIRDNFRSKLFATVMAGQIGDEVNSFRQSGVPMLVIFGEGEKICNIDYLDQAGLQLWQNKVFKIPGTGHFVHIDLPEETNELMADFASEMLK